MIGYEQYTDTNENPWGEFFCFPFRLFKNRKSTPATVKQIPTISETMDMSCIVSAPGTGIKSGIGNNSGDYKRGNKGCNRGLFYHSNVEREQTQQNSRQIRGNLQPVAQ